MSHCHSVAWDNYIMNVKNKVSTFNTILYITIDTGAVGTADRNILVMSTVVSTPAIVTAAENVGLRSSTS